MRQSRQDFPEQGVIVEQTEVPTPGIPDRTTVRPMTAEEASGEGLPRGVGVAVSGVEHGVGMTPAGKTHRIVLGSGGGSGVGLGGPHFMRPGERQRIAARAVAEMASYLRGLEFPATRDEVIVAVKLHHPPTIIQEALALLRHERYERSEQVVEDLDRQAREGPAGI